MMTESPSAELRNGVLQDYVDIMLLRDVVERHEISNVPALRQMIRPLLSAPGTLLSINSQEEM
jgi:uncharacterized protein